LYTHAISGYNRLVALDDRSALTIYSCNQYAGVPPTDRNKNCTAGALFALQVTFG
jgi:hypothetical protein